MRWVVREIYRNKETYADRYYAGRGMFAIADGLGVGKGAILSAEFVVNYLSRFSPPMNEWEMLKLFNELNKELLFKLCELGDETISGTTLSVLSLVNDHFVIGHVGDSRIYLYKEENLLLLTKDQVKYKGGKKVVRVLGLEWNPEVYTTEGKLSGGERFILISDGFINSFSENVLRKALRMRDIEETASYLEKCFRKNAKEDDLTFLIIDLE